MSTSILVVDDIEDNRLVLRDRLESRGYAVSLAADGEQALMAVAENPPDLILLDVMMPRLDGIETVKALKADRRTKSIPVILLTSKSDVRDVVAGLDAGADEYLTKPIDHAALIARVRAMLRLKDLQDELRRRGEELQQQARALAELNADLERRVSAQVAEIERVSRLKRFLAPQVAEAILRSSSGEAALQSHRADVTVLFCDLRGFTAFAESAEPEEVIELLSEYHRRSGELIFRHDGTLERFAGDGFMVLFNDPMPHPAPSAAAVQLATEIRAAVTPLLELWHRRGGGELGLGMGIAAGYATAGRVGFDKRFDYAAIGSVTNLAARLCDAAASGDILVSPRVAHEVSRAWRTASYGMHQLKGFSRPTEIFRVTGPVLEFDGPEAAPSADRQAH